MKNYMRYPIIPIAFFYVNGIFFSNQVLNFISINLIWILIIFFFLGSVVFSIKSFTQKFKIERYYQTIFFSVLFFCVGIASFQNAKTTNQIEIDDYHLGVVTINEVLKSNEHQNRYYANFTTSNNIEQKILLYQDLNFKKLEVGEQLEVPLFIESIPNSKNPYQFDYSSYLSNKQIFIQSKLPEKFILLERANGLKFKLFYFRETLMNSFKIHHFSAEVNGVINALLFGQRADLSEKIQSDYRNAGVMHILAISGMHIGILYWIINLIVKSFIRSKNARFLLVISILICFAIITGLSGSVVRAVLMFGILGSASLFQRRTDTINVLALSLLFILIVNPYFLFDIGFQMSYLAVFSIVYLYPIIRSYFQTKYIVSTYFLELIGISLVAQLGILPLSVYYFGQIPLLFLFGNLIVIPILSFVLIALVFLLILNFVWRGLSVFLGKFIAFLIDFVDAAIAYIASKNHFIITDIKMNLVQCLLFLAIVFSIAYLLKKFSYRKLIAVLVLMISLQFSYFFEAYQLKFNHKTMLLYDYSSVVFASLNGKSMVLLSDDSTVVSKKYIADLIREDEIDRIDYQFIKNYFELNGKHFLVVDSLGVAEVSFPIEVLILKDNPKFNLERYLENHHPELVVFHPKNYKSNVVFWEQTCSEKNIPFHNMRKKGFVSF